MARRQKYPKEYKEAAALSRREARKAGQGGLEAFPGLGNPVTRRRRG
ncbi:MAG: hypothetical protein LBG27_08770 [Spirochaetaceae bacterium]|nr:hypothetical protein [Spirochaetaceae bacterium]